MSLAGPVRTGKAFFDEISNKVIGGLEVGRVPWVQSWGTPGATGSLAKLKSAATGRQYSGITILILWGLPPKAHSHARAGLPAARRCRSVVTSARASVGLLLSMATVLYRSTKSGARARTARKRRPIRSSSASRSHSQYLEVAAGSSGSASGCSVCCTSGPQSPMVARLG